MIFHDMSYIIISYEWYTNRKPIKQQRYVLDMFGIPDIIISLRIPPVFRNSYSCKKLSNGYNAVDNDWQYFESHRKPAVSYIESQRSAMALVFGRMQVRILILHLSFLNYFSHYFEKIKVYMFLMSSKHVLHVKVKVKSQNCLFEKHTIT